MHHHRSSFIAVILLHLTTPSLERRVPYGPTVDPGVFVITQVRTCRGGEGYCILGHSCEIDKDFLPDDLGGHCQGLEKAFYPSANFVCCRENPANAVSCKLSSTHLNQAARVPRVFLPSNSTTNEGKKD